MKTQNSLLILFLFFFISLASGQKPPKKFGNIDKKNMEMTVYEQDLSARAVGIFDFGSTYLSYLATGVAVNFKYHLRIKILSKDGFGYADVEIPHTVDRGVIKLKAATYNLEDGKIVTYKLNRKEMFVEKVSGDDRLLKFTFPNVKEGSIIEYSFEKKQGSYERLVPWNFQMSIPVMYSEYNIRMPDYFQYKFYTRGYETIDQINQKSLLDEGDNPATQHQWIMYDVPALVKEPHMPGLHNYQSKLEFELTFLYIPGYPTRSYSQTWRSYEESLLSSDRFASVTDKANFLKDYVSEAIAGKTTDLEKLTAIHSFVKNHMEWDGRSRMFVYEDLKKPFKEGEGSSSEINFLLMAMLKQAGFQIHPVILSTRSNGIIRETARPIEANYNYVILYTEIEGKQFLLDATEPLLAFNELPAKCMNNEGRLIMPRGKSKWIPLCNNGKYEFTIETRMQVNESGELTGSLSRKSGCYAALNKRKNLKVDGEEEYIDDLKEAEGGWNIESYELINVDNEYESLIENFQLTIDGHVQDMGNMLFIDPLLGNGFNENPFKEEKRIFPIDFICPETRKVVSAIVIPEGYEVEEIPGNMTLKLPDNGGSFVYTATKNDQMIEVTSISTIKKPMFSQLEYGAIKSFFEKMVEKQSEKVVLKQVSAGSD